MRSEGELRVGHRFSGIRSVGIQSAGIQSADIQNAGLGTAGDLEGEIEGALSLARQNLLDRQQPGGAFLGALEPTVSLDAKDLLLRDFLGIRNSEETRLAAGWIRSQQREDGSFARSSNGPADLSVTVEAYTALRLAGDSAEAGPMARAARAIRDLGGVERSRVTTRFLLALFGLWPWRWLPALPPEVVLLPSWLAKVSRTFESRRRLLMPWSVIACYQPVRTLSFRIDELTVGGEGARRASPQRRGKERCAPFGRTLSGYERWPLPPLRRRALAVCERKIVEGQGVDGTWDGMYAPSISSLLALQVMGYPQDHPVIQKGVEGLKGFAGWEAGFRRTLSRPSRVWDTAAAVATLGDAGLAPDHPALVRSVDWLLEQELRGTGGWSHTSAASHPTIETTAEVTIALRSVEHPDPMRVERAVARAVAWTLNVQGRDGFWLPSEAEPGDRPHTDRAGGSRTLLSRLNLRAQEEPVSVDATARVIEMLTGEGLADDEAVSRAREWLIETQQPNGSWESALRRTAAAIPALAAAGEKPASIPVQRSRRWLLSRQNSDGGWGREPNVSDRSEGTDAPRDSTTQHTAWALLALLASGECGAAVRRGAAWLAAAQRSNGDWEPTPEAEPTGDFRNGERRMGPNLPTLALGRTVRSGGQNRLETES